MIVLWHRLIGGRITSQVPGADVGVRQEKRSHFGGRCQDLADMGGPLACRRRLVPYPLGGLQLGPFGSPVTEIEQPFYV